ncbi:MAG TPA: portal protein [Rhizomicrobium sp.]|nr:portal protein [Rhizomicrobium sp.]
MTDEQLLADARDAFALCEEAESENRIEALDDLRFAKLGEQWPEQVRQQRIKDGRPCLTINRQPAFIRQVVNEARQNRPGIQVHPVDGVADPAIAEIYNGLIRNIEQTSKADVAYDTAVDCAVSNGFGYFRINTDYADDDSFDLDLRIERIVNPFSVYGDPLSTACDSADWNQCFVTEVLGHDAFRAKYKGAEPVNWDGSGYEKLASPWAQDKCVLVAEWWRRERVKRPIVALSDGSVLDTEVYAKQKAQLDAAGVVVLGERTALRHKVTQTVLTGAEVLEKNDWAGKYIPIVPVYGDEVNVEGKRYFRSLIREAKDAQRMLNYWRTASTELTALAPRVPFIGRKGTFKSDARKWATINNQNHAFVEYDGETPPQRQPLDSGRAIGAIQEALNAQDDMKAILGMYDASLGARSNETSGRAILARQREGDTSNFHFIDNLSRAIEHGGRILIDLIPTVYSGARMIRVLGADNKPSTVQLGQALIVKEPDGQPVVDPVSSLPLTRICDLSRGKYDLTVSSGPSYASRRQETADQILRMIQAYPPAAPVLGDLLAKNLDWPDADEVTRRLHALLPPQLQAADSAGAANPLAHPVVRQAAQQAVATIGGLQQKTSVLSQQLNALQQDRGIENRKLEIDAFKAETERLKAVGEAARAPVLGRG